MTKEVRYHDNESGDEADRTDGQNYAKEKHKKNKKKKRSLPTGKGPRERERERQRARERKRAGGPRRNHQVTKTGRANASQQQHGVSGVSDDSRGRRRPAVSTNNGRMKHSSSPQRSRRQSPSKARIDVRRKSAKHHIRQPRHAGPGDSDYKVEENGEQGGRQRDRDRGRRRSRQSSQDQHRQASKSRSREWQRDRIR